MYEINLVPDVKLEMIKTLKLRNLVFFICIIVAAVMAGIVLILSMVVGGQNLAMSNQDGRLREMSTKIVGYEGINEFLTIQDQLDKLAQISDNRKLLSRTFSILNVMLPQGKDSVTISELNVSLDNSSLVFDAQADAGEEPLIDYRVLEAFKKGVALTKYDYGRYVDANGTSIPTRCIIETNEKGELLNDNGSIYAIWMRGEYGCDPERDDDAKNEKGDDEDNATSADEILDTDDMTDMSNGTASNNLNTQENTTVTEPTAPIDENSDKPKGDPTVPDEIIYRTPQFTDWYEAGGLKKDKNGYTPNMTLDGKISDVPHFESSCYRYTGSESYSNNKSTIKWNAENDCLLAPNGVDVRESSNGKDTSGNLVLRFSATINLAEDIFMFKNKHVMAIGPSGQNVTDSYVQIEGMFDERAKDCDVGDTSCATNTDNVTGGNTNERQ